METTLNGILNHRVMLEQPKHDFRVAVDTVLLAAAVPAQAGDRVLDLGCGVGGAMLCVAARVPGIVAVGIEIQNELVEICQRNIGRNGFATAEVFCGDVMKLESAIFGESGAIPLSLAGGVRGGLDQPVLSASFDHVLMNPPYHDEATHDVSTHKSKRRANAGQGDELAGWISAVARALKDDGTLTIIHRADRESEILNIAAGHFGGAEILHILPKQDMPPKRVILRLCKNKRHASTSSNIFILHNQDGTYAPQADAILRGAMPLNF
jgi:tRNA1(Val) A37 N6-methylase TrmN6